MESVTGVAVYLISVALFNYVAYVHLYSNIVSLIKSQCVSNMFIRGPTDFAVLKRINQMISLFLCVHKTSNLPF